MKSRYSWNTARCVRFGEDFTGENHPCYWCGKPPENMLDPKMIWCDKCGGFVCPSCGCCWCSVLQEEFEALKLLRDKYCCNWLNFKEGIKPEDILLLDVVQGFKKALDYCRAKKGFK